jgi:alpha-glucosidase
MQKLLWFSIILLLTINISCARKYFVINSPSKSLSAKIVTEDSGLILKLSNSNNHVVTCNLGKFVFDKDDSWNTYLIKGVKHTSKDEVWKPVYGEKSVISDKYNEVEITLADKDYPEKTIQLICRAYNEGIAFRYKFDKNTSSDLLLTREFTSFNFDYDYEAWVTDRAQGIYKKKKISEINIACERPLVIKKNDTSFLALGEAALVDYARMKFINDTGNPLSLQVTLDGNVDLDKAGYITPWRYIMIAENPAKLLENNYFILNLNEPDQLENNSWIKPGKVIREVTLSTQGGLACIDFAAKHNLQYVEFDAGWYGNEYDDQSDASTISVDPKRSPGPLDLHMLIEYGNKKGIGIILYVNRRAMEKQLVELLPLYKSWGVKGLKYGFVNVGTQEWTSWLHNAIRKAAEYELMVDVHDEYRPTGYSRTYPNFMTQEGIRGDEESPSIGNTLITLFTRMIAGAGDNTNCYFAPRVNDLMGGKAAQLAKSVMLYSPWQFIYWYDRPQESHHKKGGAGSSIGIIQENADLQFFDDIPTVWDDTKVLEGKIGEYATIARKSEDTWFIGSLTSDQTRQVMIPLTFLDEEEDYEIFIYYQNSRDLETDQVRIESKYVDQETVLSQNLPENSGFAALIIKK